MGMQIYKKYIYYVKSTGICIVVMGLVICKRFFQTFRSTRHNDLCFLHSGCWFLYQLRQASQILRSTVPTNVLNLEQMHAQYIYIDDPRYKGISQAQLFFVSAIHFQRFAKLYRIRICRI